MLGAFAGGGKYSLSAMREVEENPLLGIRPYLEDTRCEGSNARTAVEPLHEPVIKPCMAVESSVTASLEETAWETI